jgi:hypothetical protein
VLPADATPTEIIHRETELQVAKEQRLVHPGIRLPGTVQRKRPDFALVAAMNHRPARDITSDYEMIQQVNQLVDLSNGRWLQVDFKLNESAFDDLAPAVQEMQEKVLQGAERRLFILGS